MENYFNYLAKMITSVFQNIGLWFQMTFAVPWSPVPNEFTEYGGYFNQFSPGFGVGGWIMFILFAIL
ncbi:MAG: hypothetical protein K5694_06445, partial [Bacilli bacterium]|nr:hypothetical protein [Bacilli bacterium]